ncbi:MAG: class I SAM-dependent methyltransferase [Verrucomicrobia bacterium]|nr:class I SAM-dependent methyltransferase [Verrucomicrobiota bacterium]
MNPAQNPVTELVTRYKAELGSITELIDPTMHIFIRLLELQSSRGIGGDMMEIGVFRAGTASLLAAKLKEKERMFLIDPTQNQAQNRQTIEAFAKVKPEQLIFHVLDSLVVNKWREKVLSPSVPLVRFAHIDGEHSYDGVYSDLELARRYITSGGIIVLDDIFNMNSACCTHAMFDYLRDQPLVHLVAMGYRKAYLCESRHVAGYRRFFASLPELLGQTANLHVRLCFNSWAHERSYVTFDDCEPTDPHYQVIGKRFQFLSEALAAIETLT